MVAPWEMEWASPAPSRLPRGLRNNNPLNLEATVNWTGMQGNDGRFAVFPDLETGVAAADRNLQTYHQKHGLNTVEGIVNRWAPPTENDSRAYAMRVSQTLGVDPTAPLDMTDPSVRRALLDAMADVENGQSVDLGSGPASPAPWEMAWEASPPAPPARREIARSRSGGVTIDLAEDVSGFMANVNRGLGIGDEIAGAAQAVGDVISGRSKVDLPRLAGGIAALPFAPAIALPLLKSSGAPEAFKKGMKTQRDVEDTFARNRPKAAALGKGTGNAVTALVPVGPVASAALAPRALNAAKGAVTAGLTGAAYAAADRGAPKERLRSAASAATNPVVLGLGAGLGALSPALPGAPKKVRPQTVLKAAGVQLTPGQKVGGLVKTTEDLAQRAPILGPAISGARERANEQLSRAVALRALEPVGKTLPKNIPAGFDTVKYVDDALGQVYDDAAAMVPRVAPDAAFADDLTRIAERKADLPDNLQATFDSIVSNRLNRLGGEVSGAQLKAIHGELGGVQRQYAGKGGAEAILGDMIGDVRRSLMGLMGRANPEAADMIARADQGWSIYTMLNSAAGAAQGRGGVPTPGQLGTAVRQAGNKYSSKAVGRGEAKLQDLVTAAQRVMPDQFGNPGTANALGLGALAVGLPTNPVGTIGTAAGLTAAATPYYLMGRRMVEQLPPSATVGDLQAVAEQLAELAARDPAVAGLYSQVAARLAVAAGVSGASATAAQGASTQGPPRTQK